MTSAVATHGPTAAPTLAPTSFDADHVAFLLEKWVIVSSVVGGVLCLLALYYGYHSVLAISLWWRNRLDRIERDHMDKVDDANRRLTDRFVRGDADKSPHTSQMRENFKKQFGTMPSHGNDGHDDWSEGISLASAPPGGGAAGPSPGKLTRTLVTKLPRSEGSLAPARGPAARGRRVPGGVPGDEETGDAIRSAPRSPGKHALSRDVDFSSPHDKDDKSNRLAERSGRGTFGFALDRR
jgi:hypothetical protein